MATKMFKKVETYHFIHSLCWVHAFNVLSLCGSVHSVSSDVGVGSINWPLLNKIQLAFTVIAVRPILSALTYTNIVKEVCRLASGHPYERQFYCVSRLVSRMPRYIRRNSFLRVTSRVQIDNDCVQVCDCMCFRL